MKKETIKKICIFASAATCGLGIVLRVRYSIKELEWKNKLLEKKVDYVNRLMCESNTALHNDLVRHEEKFHGIDSSDKSGTNNLYTSDYERYVERNY